MKHKSPTPQMMNLRIILSTIARRTVTCRAAMEMKLLETLIKYERILSIYESRVRYLYRRRFSSRMKIDAASCTPVNTTRQISRLVNAHFRRQTRAPISSRQGLAISEHLVNARFLQASVNEFRLRPIRIREASHGTAICSFSAD